MPFVKKATPIDEDKKEEKVTSEDSLSNKQESVKPVEADPKVAELTAQLEEQLLKANELNKRLEEKEKELNEKAKAFSATPPISPVEQANVLQKHQSKAQRMKEHLAGQEKVTMFIPLEGKEKPGTTEPVTINGYRLNVPKGVYVKVPLQVADILKDYLKQTQEALNNPFNLDNASEQKKDALEV